MEINPYKDTNLYIVEVRKSDGPKVFAEVFEFFTKNWESEKVKLLGVFEEFEEFESVKYFVETMQVDHTKIKRLEKYAALSNARWLEQVLEFERKLVPNIPFKFFKSGNKKKAIDWLLYD